MSNINPGLPHRTACTHASMHTHVHMHTYLHQAHTWMKTRINLIILNRYLTLSQPDFSLQLPNPLVTVSTLLLNASGFNLQPICIPFTSCFYYRCRCFMVQIWCWALERDLRGFSFCKILFYFLLDIFAVMNLLFIFQKTKQQRNLCSDKGCHSAFRYSVGTVL